MTKRSYIRIVSYIAFMLVVVISATIISTTSMKTYKSQLELSYQQSLAELSECLDNVNTNITKSIYSNSYGEIYDLSRDLYAQCSTAKNAMSRLPIGQLELSNAYKFLSQVSDYAQYIGTKIEKGEKISDSEHKALVSLMRYADKFNKQAKSMVNMVNNGNMITDNQVKSERQINVTALSNSFTQSAEVFNDFPTLIYDGPFSDQILNRNSEIVSKAKVMTREDCKKIAAKVLGVELANINYETDDKSNIPCFTFKCGRYTILITKQGGYVKEILYSGIVSKSNITDKNACNLAIDYLKNIGYNDMEVCYYSTRNNICTVNCAYKKGNVRYYSDIIKCSVSLDNGEIASLDAATYLTNHIDRKAMPAKITAIQAQSKLSKYLEVKGSRLCVIPKESGREVQCYEFTCRGKDTGDDILVYINSDTGNEEDIMIMLNTDNGTMVK